MKKSKMVIGKTKQKTKSQNKVKTKKSNKSRKKNMIKTKPSINNKKPFAPASTTSFFFMTLC